MRVRHPVALEDDGVVDDAVYVEGEEVPIDDDGTFEVADRRRSWLESWAAAYDHDPDDLIIDQEGVPPDDEATPELSWDPNEHTVDEVREHVSSIDGDDILAEMQAILEAEREGKDRTTAKDAIEARIGELEG